MSIVIRQDGTKQNSAKQDDVTQVSQLSISDTIAAISTTQQYPKNRGSIIYGGRGPKSALQNRIGLAKTAGVQQFER